MADHRHRLPRLDAQVDIAKYPVLPFVGERDAVEADAARVTRRYDRTFPRVDLYFRIQQLEDALGRCHGPLKDVELLGEIADGTEELLGVLYEGDEPPERERTEEDLASSVPDDESEGDRAQNLHDGIEDRIVQDRLQIRVGMLAVELAVLAELAIFLTKELHDPHADDVLLDEGVEHRDPCADLPIDDPYASLEDQGHGEEHGEHGERHEREPPIEVDEDTP